MPTLVFKCLFLISVEFQLFTFLKTAITNSDTLPYLTKGISASIASSKIEYPIFFNFSI